MAPNGPKWPPKTPTHTVGLYSVNFTWFGAIQTLMGPLGSKTAIEHQTFDGSLTFWLWFYLSYTVVQNCTFTKYIHSRCRRTRLESTGTSSGICKLNFGFWTRGLLFGLGMTQGDQLDHSLLLILPKPLFDNVLPEHVGLPHVLPLAVHLDFCSEQLERVILRHFNSWVFFCVRPPAWLKVLCGWWVGWVKFLFPFFEFILTLGVLGLGLGLGLVN